MDSPQNTYFHCFDEQDNEIKITMISAMLLNKSIISFHDTLPMFF